MQDHNKVSNANTESKCSEKIVPKAHQQQYAKRREQHKFDFFFQVVGAQNKSQAAEENCVSHNC